MEGNYDVTAINHLTVQHESTSVTRCWNKKLPNLFCKCCPKSSHCSFHLKSNVSEMDQKVAQYLRDFSKKICYQDFSKIAKSGHTQHGRKKNGKLMRLKEN